MNQCIMFAGGQIVSTQNTQGYNIKSQITRIFGFPLYHQNYNNYPHTVIQNNPMQPGNCWAFQNFPGYLLIRLQNIIYVTGFTLEHASRLIISTESMSSAPRKFNVWVCNNNHFCNTINIETILFGIILLR